MRYTLAFTLFGYGFAKDLPHPPIPLTRLRKASGNVRRFFSLAGRPLVVHGRASTAYIIFAGTAEVLPGLLLLFRRTTTLGGLAAFAVLLNVVALNFCYDVPVKLYSTNLVLMSLYRLVAARSSPAGSEGVFLLNRAAAPVDRTRRRASHTAGRASARLCFRSCSWAMLWAVRSTEAGRLTKRLTFYPATADPVLRSLRCRAPFHSQR